jgi:hypothetical protein
MSEKNNLTPLPATSNSSEGYLTKEQLAQRLNKSLSTVQRWQADGIIPYVKVSQSVMYHWPDVQQHLQQNYRVCRKRRVRKTSKKASATPTQQTQEKQP